MSAAPADSHTPGRPSLPSHDYQAFLAQPAFGFEHQRSQRMAAEPAAANFPEIMRKSFFRGIQKETPCDVFVKRRRLRPQRRKHQPHHHRSAFDIMRAGSVNAVAFRLPVEIVSSLFFRWKNSVEVRNHRKRALRAAGAG